MNKLEAYLNKGDTDQFISNFSGCNAFSGAEVTECEYTTRYTVTAMKLKLHRLDHVNGS